MINLVNVRSTFLTDEMVMPPLGLLYLKAALTRRGIDSKFIDLSNGDELPTNGQFYISATTPQIEEAKKLSKKGYTVIGGPHASVDPHSLIDYFDCVVVGEGEDVIPKIAIHKLRGIVYADSIRELDKLPFPDRDPVSDYKYFINGQRATTMVTSRGCTGKCSFCCKAVMNKGIFFRSAENVVEELTLIKNHYGYEAVMFYDDSLAMKKGRLIEICKGLKQLKMTWRCFARSDQVDYELLAMMADSGCYEILFGIESGSNQILKNIRKHETREQHINAVILSKIAGIRVKALMIVGLPGETPETIQESKSFIQAAEPDDLDVTVLSVYKGCDIYNNPDRYELTFSDPTWYKGKPGEYPCSVETPAMKSDEIVEAREMLWKTFNAL